MREVALVRNDLVVKRRRRIALSGDLRCDALIDLRRQSGVHQNRQLGLPQHIDKAGRNDATAGIDGLAARRGCQIANRRDASAANTQIRRVPGRAGPIDDVAVDDHRIEGPGGCGRGGCPRGQSYAPQQQQAGERNSHHQSP